MDFSALIPQLPFTNPVLIFFLVLIIILFTPILLNRLRIPHIIGLILAGVLIGPNGLGLLARDSSFEIFGKVGLLYIMFVAGLEMNLNDFKQNRNKGIVFGLYTFFIPMILGTIASYYLLHFNFITSVLLASMYASHTLVTYPIVSRFGLSRKPAVVISIAGTIITVMGALIILAVITGMYKGVINSFFWIKLTVSILLFFAFIIYTFPRIMRWFLKRYDDSVSQYIFVLALVFAASFIAELAGLEAIIGAFLAGVVLNRFIPSVSPLMNRIEFVGNALFIPYFLIGVGMLIDLGVLIGSGQAMWVAFNMCVVATVTKWLAAYVTQKNFKMSSLDRKMIFGLSNSQAAATLAAVLIGYDIIVGYAADGTAIRLLNGDVLNGAIIMILVTCTISSFVTQQAAKGMAKMKIDTDKIEKGSGMEERILIPVANPETIRNLVNLALLIKNPKRKSVLYALTVTDSHKESSGSGILAQTALRAAAKVGSSADVQVETIARYDLNIASGIVNVVKEKNISEVVIGLHHRANIVDTFFGNKTEAILKGMNRMLLISKCLIPINTITRMVVVVPAQAEYETGFALWIDRIANMGAQVCCRVIFYATQQTAAAIAAVINKEKYQFRVEYELMDDWNDLPLLIDVVKQDDLFIVVLARPNSISYNSDFEELPSFLAKRFSSNNLVVLYPEQFGDETDTTFFSDPMAMSVHGKIDVGLPVQRWWRKLWKH